MTISYITRIKTWWKGKQQAKEEERIKNSPVYNQLIGRHQEQERLLDALKEDLIKAKSDFAEYEKVSSAKLSERDEKILGLEKSLQESEKLAIEYTEDAVKIEDENKKLSSDNQKLSASYALSKRYLSRFKQGFEEVSRELKSSEQVLEGELTTRSEKLEKELRDSYMKNFGKLSTSLENLIGTVRADVKQYRDEMSKQAALFFTLFEKELFLNRIEGVYIDSSFRPVYATPGFYKLFNLSLASDLLKAQHLPEIIEHIKHKRKEPYKFEAIIGKTERKIEAHIRYALDRSQTVIGAFIEYEYKQGIFERLSFGGSEKDRVRAGENIEKMFDESKGLGSAPATG